MNPTSQATPHGQAPALAPEVAAFVALVRESHPDLDLGTPTVRKYGDTASMSKRIIDVILSGAKTGGFSPLLRYERTGAALPSAGECCIVTDHAGAPALLYRLVEVEVVPYGAIDERHTAVEAPELRELGAWRRFHWTFWGREFEKYGVPLSEDMPIVYQRFRLIYPRAASAT